MSNQVRENSVVELTVRGAKRRVSVGEKRSDGSYEARLRAPLTGNSVRGVLRSTRQGLRFTPTNQESMWVFDN